MLPALLSYAMTIDEYYKNAMREVRKELDSMSLADLEANPDEELLEYFYYKTVVERVELDPTRPPVSVPEVLPDDYRNSDMREKGHRVLVELPLIARGRNPFALQLRASSSWPGHPNLDGQAFFRTADHVIELRIPMEAVAEKVSMAKQMMFTLSNELERWYVPIRERIQEAIARRRSALQAEASRFDRAYERYQQSLDSLGITLKRNPGAVEPVNVQVKKRVQVLRKARPVPNGPSEPYLVPEALQSILGLIDQAGKGFETAPGVFGKLEEEELRTIILGYLNSVFAMTVASGETFSKSGKTDILLNVPGGPVLIAECHCWAGPKKYSKKIHQLFGYLTWRQTTGLMVTFSRNKGLTKVIEEADSAIQLDCSYRGGFGAKTVSYRVSTHEHPEDAQKRVDLHHLFFSLYSE